MTMQELSQHARIRERLAEDESILMSLRESASPKAAPLTGMPSTTGTRDKVGDLAIEIADMEVKVKYLREDVSASEKRIGKFISNLKDERLRIVIRLRFLRGLTWQQTADVLGTKYTEETVKRMCYRYFGMHK